MRLVASRNFAGSAGAYALALCTTTNKPSDDRPPCLENLRPEGAEPTLTQNVPPPFHAEPRQDLTFSFPTSTRKLGIKGADSAVAIVVVVTVYMTTDGCGLLTA